MSIVKQTRYVFKASGTYAILNYHIANYTFDNIDFKERK